MQCLKYLAIALLAVFAQPASAAPFTFVALGDMPYFTPADYDRFEGLIEQINQEQPVFSIHVGDIKGGSTPCTHEAFEEVRERFDLFDQPLFYTPGDNDWTDCHRTGFNAQERLAKIREMFFAEPRSLGRRTMPYERQADDGEQGREHDQMVENATWTHEGVRFATVHVVGSNNGKQEEYPGAVAEFKLRDRANKDWIAAIGKRARKEAAAALVFAFHADPWVKGGGNGFKRTLKALVKAAETFGGPVLLVHGDIHSYRVDQPLQDKNGKTLANVTRLRVMGSPDLRAVRVTVDADADVPFRFELLNIDP